MKIFVLICSLLIHGFIFWGLQRDPEHTTQLKEKPQPIKFVVTTNTTQFKTKTKSTTSIKHQTTPTTYKDLFPTGNSLTTSTASNFSASTSSNAAGDDDISILPALKAFAKQVENNLQIPDALASRFNTSAAELRLVQKSAGKFTIRKVTGDPYFRALLYERISELLESPINSLELSNSHIDRVTVALSYRKVIVTNPQDAEVQIFFSGNKITFDFTKYVVDERLTVLYGGPGTIAINPIAAALLVYHQFHKEDDRDNPDLSKLRLSPAFSTPIK